MASFGKLLREGRLLLEEEAVDLKAVVKTVVDFLSDVGETPDWITKFVDAQGNTKLKFLRDAKRKYRHLDSKQLSRWNAKWRSTRKKLLKFGLIADPSTEPIFRTADGKVWEISVGGLSGGPGSGEQIPVP